MAAAAASAFPEATAWRIVSCSGHHRPQTIRCAGDCGLESLTGHGDHGRAEGRHGLDEVLIARSTRPVPDGIHSRSSCFAPHCPRRPRILAAPGPWTEDHCPGDGSRPEPPPRSQTQGGYSSSCRRSSNVRGILLLCAPSGPAGVSAKLPAPRRV